MESTTQIWAVTRHQYGISAFVPRTSFRGETSGGRLVPSRYLSGFWGLGGGTRLFP